MKTWKEASIEEINIATTSNQPTAEVAVDDLLNGVFTFGKRDGSGPAGEIIYTPTDY